MPSKGAREIGTGVRSTQIPVTVPCTSGTRRERGGFRRWVLIGAHLETSISASYLIMQGRDSNREDIEAETNMNTAMIVGI